MRVTARRRERGPWRSGRRALEVPCRSAERLRHAPLLRPGRRAAHRGRAASSAGRGARGGAVECPRHALLARSSSTRNRARNAAHAVHPAFQRWRRHPSRLLRAPFPARVQRRPSAPLAVSPSALLAARARRAREGASPVHGARSGASPRALRRPLPPRSVHPARALWRCVRNRPASRRPRPELGVRRPRRPRRLAPSSRATAARLPRPCGRRVRRIRAFRRRVHAAPEDVRASARRARRRVRAGGLRARLVRSRSSISSQRCAKPRVARSRALEDRFATRYLSSASPRTQEASAPRAETRHDGPPTRTEA